jgi:DNA-binding XRE family transcriptional regulator
MENRMNLDTNHELHMIRVGTGLSISQFATLIGVESTVIWDVENRRVKPDRLLTSVYAAFAMRFEHELKVLTGDNRDTVFRFLTEEKHFEFLQWLFHPMIAGYVRANDLQGIDGVDAQGAGT